MHTLAGNTLPAYSQMGWPVAEDTKGEPIDLSRVRPPEAQKYIEYGILGILDHRYCVWNHRLNIGFGMNWDDRVFPYLWVWGAGLRGYGLSLVRAELYPWHGTLVTSVRESGGGC